MIAGWSGAGKTSIANALARAMEPISGKIYVDGVDTMKVNQLELREKITFITQNPVMLWGSLWFNLDPDNKRSDEDIQRLLVKAQITKPMSYEVEERGTNLSSGELSILQIIQAILWRNKIVVMDESTSSLDLDT